MKKTWKIRVALVVSATMGIFDGAVQSSIGGASMVLFFSKSHYFHLVLYCCPSMNTKAKLISLLGLIFVSSVMGIPHLRVFGYSRIIID